MLIHVKSKELFRMGGKVPKDLLIQEGVIKEIARAPLNFILALSLKPGHRFSSEELSKQLEVSHKSPPDLILNRTSCGQVVLWTSGEDRKDPLWTANKPIEGVSNSLPYIMGGSGSFWPLPLQRQGPYSTMMWEATLPEGITSGWLNKLGEDLTSQFEDCLWTISKRCDFCTPFILLC